MRKVLALSLIVLGCLLAIPAVTASWLDRQVTDTDRYVSTVVPLAENPAVRAAVATRVSDAILEKIGSERRAVEPLVRTTVDRIVNSETFQRLWSTLNRTVQPELVKLLRGQTSSVQIEGDAVVLDLAPIAQAAKDDLLANGHQFASNIPPVEATFQLYTSSKVSTAQRAFQAVEKLSTWLPIVAIGLLLIGLLVAPDRWKALIWAGLGLALAMLILAVVVWFGRQRAIDAAHAPDAMGVVYDALTAGLRKATGTIFAISALIGGATLAWRRWGRQRPSGVGSVDPTRDAH